MKIFNQEIFSINKIGLFFLLIVFILVGFYFLHYKSDDVEVNFTLDVNAQSDIPLNKREEALGKIILPSETITPKSSDPVGSHTIVDKKVQ